MSHSRKSIPITSNEQLEIGKSMFRGNEYVHFTVTADDVVRGSRRTGKGFSIRKELVPVIVQVLTELGMFADRSGLK